MSKKIFISHATMEYPNTDVLRDILEQNNITTQGESVSFIDPRAESYEPGESIRDSIKRQIKSASEVVLIATDESLSSQWVNYEIGMADALEKPIVVIGPKGTGKTTLFASLEGVRLLELEEKANK